MILKDRLNEMISVSLMRKSVDTCSKWTERYRIIPDKRTKQVKPWSFYYMPWLKDMHDSKATKNVGRKAAQMGFTETLLNWAFYSIDVERTDVLYVLPNKTPDASDFSSARFDAALDLSDHLAGLFSDVRNVGHKRAGSTNLYIRGSRSRGGLKSIPVGRMALDEFDEMDMAQVVLAIERMSGQFSKQLWEISTPTVENWGIDKEMKDSTDQHYMFVCPKCHRMTELIYPDCIVITADNVRDSRINESHYRCKECKKKLDHETKPDWLANGVWEPTRKCDPDIQGWFIPQMYSPTITPVEFARAALKADLDQTDEQEFFNSKLGLPHVPKGAQVTDEDIESCIKPYRMSTALSATELTTMGVDVGNWLHVEIDTWELDKAGPDINTTAMCRNRCVLKVRNFEDLDELMQRYQVQFCVVDMFPEKRKAKEFADRFYGYVKLCYYGRGTTGKSISAAKQEDELVYDHQITVDRTSWLDVALSRFKNQRIELARDLPDEYKEHIKALVRRYDKDDYGNPTSRYMNTGPDHFGHARTYAEIALPFAMSRHTNEDVRNFL